MKKRLLSVGDKYGHLVVLSEESRPDNKGRMRRWIKVRCDCGNELEVYVSNLLKPNHTTSCGCYGKQQRIEKNQKHGHSCKSDGRERTRTYRTWEAMKQRCYNSKSRDYENYGARGIHVCDRWLHSFESFLQDMGESAPGLFIDRINNDGNYEPSNCRWATALEQVYNRRCTKRVVYRGKEYTLRELADMSGIEYGTIEMRIYRGWDVEKAVDTPVS